jgi:hypothetical protein
MTKSPKESNYSDKEVIDALIGWIEKCASFLKKPNYEVQYNEFVSFCSKDNENIEFHLFQSRIKQLGGFSNIRDSAFLPKIPKEKLITSATAKSNRALAKKNTLGEVYLNTFEKVCKKVFDKPIVIVKPEYKKTKNVNRHLHLLISDTHFGANLYSEEGNQRYIDVEPSRRLAQVALQAIEYKKQYRKETKLFVNLNGDILNGVIHDPTSSQRMAVQKAMALHLLIQFLGNLSAHFPEIEVNCSSGNHDRYPDKNPERVVAERWDSHATDVYFALKIACQVANLSNVKINVTKAPWITYKSFDANYFGTHGDSIIKISNPGSAINVKSLENQVNKLNASLKDNNEYKVVFLGHVHTGMVLRLSNGVTLVTNPALIPPDPYANSVGIFEAQSGQLLWESVEGHPFGDSRFLVVDEDTDKDASLDKIIKPFVGF